MLNFKGMRLPIDVILVCIRWYAAYPLSYRDLEEKWPGNTSVRSAAAGAWTKPTSRSRASGNTSTWLSTNKAGPSTLLNSVQTRRRKMRTDSSPMPIPTTGSLGMRPKALLTDNGSAFRSRSFKTTCSELKLKHRFTRPYRPQTNGMAERFIQSALREWAYGFVYNNSQERSNMLKRWNHHYN